MNSTFWYVIWRARKQLNAQMKNEDKDEETPYLDME